MLPPYAPGSRVVIRDEEWLIRRVDPAVDGGWLLSCDGVSDLVRGQCPLFLTTLEDDVEVLDPAETELVPDASPTYNATVLYLEGMRAPRRRQRRHDPPRTPRGDEPGALPAQPGPAGPASAARAHPDR